MPTRSRPRRRARSKRSEAARALSTAVSSALRRVASVRPASTSPAPTQQLSRSFSRERPSTCASCRRASAVKMAYAAWTKGTAALLLAIGLLAEAEGVEAPLLEEWRLSLPELPEAATRAARSAAAKGWRWVGEMDEIAATFAAAGLPDGFHRAAAEMFRSVP